MKLERLNLRLAHIEAERNIIRKEVQALKLSMSQDTSSSLWSTAAGAAVGILLIASFFISGISHDAQSKVKENGPVGSAMSALESKQAVQGKHQSTSSKKPRQRSGKVFSRAKKASQKQWGPSLVMPDPEAGKRYYGYDSLVKSNRKIC